MHVYKFRDCLLNTLERSVIRDNDHLELTTKTFDVLQFLIENAGKVVTKDDILGKVWNGSFVEESNLPVHISKLRRSLGEAKDRKFIETVQGVGYRFVSPLESLSETEWKAAAATSRPPQPTDGVNSQSIAVLPFENESGDPNINYLVDGLTESLINGLSHTPGLRVIARNTVFRYRSSNIELPELGASLSVGKLLFGRLRLTGESVQISVELIDAVDSRQIWGELYDVPFSKIVEVERWILEEVQKSLVTTIIDPSFLSVQPTANAESYKYYLMGKYVFQKRLVSEVCKAIDYFQKSISYCPTNVHSYVAVVDAFVYLFMLDQASYSDTLTNIAPLLEILSKLKQSIDVVQFMHARLALRLNWNLEIAESRVKEALRLNPNLIEAQCFYGHVLVSLGRKADVELQARKILLLDPVSPSSLRYVGRMFYLIERYDAAVACFNDALELEPEDFESLVMLGAVYTELGEYDYALHLIKKSYACQKHIETLAMMGYIEAMAGNRQEAMDVLASISCDMKTPYGHPMNLARIHLALDEKETTYQLLEQAFEQHSVEMYTLSHDPRWRSIKTEKRFRDLICRVRVSPGKEL
ncbi:MAG: hypothetical protein DMF63_10930 [Acidobacteria bacterium]|nr:MAG: hypothetical protein DMF63_10930 [Acidobacteriota bacterium]